MDIVRAPNPKLRVKTKPVKKITPLLIKLTKQMIRLTKTFIDPEGVGLASTQIGEGEQFFVGKIKNGEFEVCFNPKILKFSKRKKVYFEGCLSIPDYYGEIERHAGVTVSYHNTEGLAVKAKLTGVPAWIFQHELDHLEGRLFMDHVLEKKSRLFKVVGRDKTGSEVFEEVTL